MNNYHIDSAKFGIGTTTRNAIQATTRGKFGSQLNFFSHKYVMCKK